MESYVKEVLNIGRSMGFSYKYMQMFILDIEICYEDEMTPEQCVEKVF